MFERAVLRLSTAQPTPDNAVFFENYWNAGSPREQRRCFDDLAIATERIGCD